MTDDSSSEATGQLDQTAQARCPHCGSETEPSWAFCGSCGQNVILPRQTSQSPTTATLAPGVPTEETDRGLNAISDAPRVNGPWKRRIGIAALLCLTAIAGIGWVQQVRTSNDLDQRTRDLESTRSTLAATRTDLSATTDDLKSTKTALADRTKELKETKTDLDRANGKLSGARDRLDLQAGQIATLRICLTGVQRALSYVAYGDFTSALNELEDVETACRKANDSL